LITLIYYFPIAYYIMGQENDKVEFEGHRQTNSRRRPIFNRDSHEKPREICDVPGCTCSLKHQEFNTKICSSCLQSPPPFLKTKYQPIYYEEEHPLEQPQ
jgi:hypothetical protein